MGHELVQERRAAWFNRTECHNLANRDAQQRVVTFEQQPTASFYLLVSKGFGTENQPPQPRFLLANETLNPGKHNLEPTSLAPNKQNPNVRPIRCN